MAVTFWAASSQGEVLDPRISESEKFCITYAVAFSGGWKLKLDFPAPSQRKESQEHLSPHPQVRNMKSPHPYNENLQP